MHRATTPTSPASRAWRWIAAAAAVAAAVAAMAPAAAQYKVVGPDGRVTYTDRPPSDAGARVSTMRRDGVVEAPSTVALPAELSRVAAKYPVTLYTTADCAPCEEARQLLAQRGVPYSEKRVVTEDDAAALQALFGARTVPSLTIGSQALRGLAAAEWNAYLDAAGYPRESRLPRGWQAASAPMSAGRPAEAPAPVQPRPPPPPRPPAPDPPQAGGIRF
jgi:glutaredoxin